VHVASHGVFGHSAESTFIMAYDRLLKLDELEQILKGSPSQRQRIDLLTLSACQTAEGDDRAPLGFTGVALKTRVRGAMGTLWPVDDEAAAKLMPEFYGALTSGKSKVVALREAQLKLLHTHELRHPYFWSPFILVGNWL
jgi:CHAT domain-containing protein